MLSATGPDTTVGEHSGREIVFDFEGRQLRAIEGESVAAALIANGLRVFGRSTKYHRPRGYRCGHGHCSCCAMRVDGLPGVRTCATTVHPGMNVEREHAWPTADHDVLRASELLSPLMPPGFYYRWFRRSPRLFGVFERSLAHVAGQGRMPSIAAINRLSAAHCERVTTSDVLVVGGGVAGMSAALAAADQGAHVLLLERDDCLGGQAVDESVVRAESDDNVSSAESSGATQAVGLASQVIRHQGIGVLTRADAIGWYEEGTIAVDLHPDLLLVDPSAVVLATGSYELGLPFPNCDLPGVMLASGAQRLLSRYNVRPGSTAVVVTLDDSAYAVALQLVASGVEVHCVADCRAAEQVDERLTSALKRKDIAVLAGVTALHAHGFNRVSSISLRSSSSAEALSRRFPCDLVCVSAGFRPAHELEYQALCRGKVTLSMLSSAEPGAGKCSDGAGPWLAGRVVGAESVAVAVQQGQAAGRAVASCGR